MASKKITELTALTTPASTDVVPIVDLSGTPATKKSTLAQIASALSLAISQITGLVAALAAKVETTVSLTAGAGLTGGGDLSGNRTFAVGAGTGITANADDVAVNYGTTSITACVGNDSRLSDARTPTAHATTHKSAGSDPIMLDELKAPTDITTLDVSTSLHGLIPKAVAPGAGLQNVYGIANGETAVTNKALFDTTNPAALGTVAPGTSLIAARRDHVHALPTNALLDGAIHTDTTASAVTRGDLIYGNSTPAWDDLAVGTGVLQANGTDVTGWTQAPALTTPSMTIPVVSTRIDLTGGQVTFPAAQVASSDANTLDDYEEGVWTPQDTSGAGLTLASDQGATALGSYVKFGQMVCMSYNAKWPVTADTSVARLGNWPFTTHNVSGEYWGGINTYTDSGGVTINANPNATASALYGFSPGVVAQTNAQMSEKQVDGNIQFRCTG